MKKSTVYSLIFSFLIFLALNIPSIKILYSTPVINVVAFIGIIGVGVFRTFSTKKDEVPMIRIRFLIAFYVIWIMLLIPSLLNISNVFSFGDLMQYLAVMLVVTGVILFIDKRDIPRILYFQVLWAIFLSVTHLTVGINLSRELGQHYLTLGLPLAAGIVCAFAFLFYLKTKLIYNIGLILSIYLSMTVLISLNGRSPLLLSVLVPVMIILISLFTERNVLKRMKKVLGIIVVGGPVGYLIYKKVSESNLFNRLNQALDSLEDEPRNAIYNKSIDLIKETPLGHGLRPDVFYTTYPHNIFLEIGVSGGVIALLSFITFMVFMLTKIVRGIKIGTYALATSSLTLVFFLTWNLSYDLTSSYIPFIALALLVVIIEGDKDLRSKPQSTYTI